MIYFPTTFEELEEVYNYYGKDISTAHWQITCSGENNNKVVSQLLSDNALSMFFHHNTLYVTVARYGIDVGINKDSYRHSKIYYGEVSDLKDKWKAFGGEGIKKLFITLFDRTGNSLHRWTFKNCLIKGPTECVLDMWNGRTHDKEGEYLVIPIMIDTTHPEISESLIEEKRD